MRSQEYFYSKESFIHELSSDDIFSLLRSSAWTAEGQEITSAETNNDSGAEPNPDAIAEGENTAGVNAYADLELGDDVKVILDVGGGKFDVCMNYMKSRGVDLLVYDPYNRPQKHNVEIKRQVMAQKVSVATSMSVLNVVPEPEIRLAHICTLKDALTINGMAYFKVWPGQDGLKGTYQPTVNSYGYPGYQANAGADRFLREVQLVFGLMNVELHETIPNLIVARKISDEPTSKKEIEEIQRLEMKDAWFVGRRQSRPQGGAQLFQSHQRGEGYSLQQLKERLLPRISSSKK